MFSLYCMYNLINFDHYESFVHLFICSEQYSNGFNVVHIVTHDNWFYILFNVNVLLSWTWWRIFVFFNLILCIVCDEAL